MQEYWVNVYQDNEYGTWFGLNKSPTKDHLIRCMANVDKPVYRIHVKMKPKPNIEPKYDDWQYGEVLEKNYFKNNLD